MYWSSGILIDRLEPAGLFGERDSMIAAFRQAPRNSAECTRDMYISRQTAKRRWPTPGKLMQVLTLLSSLVSVCLTSAAENRDMEGFERIRYRLDAASGEEGAAPMLGDLRWPDEVFAFYQRRTFRPAWSANGEINDQAIELLRAIRTADTHGLRPGDYHIEAIAQALSARDTGLKAEARDELDLLLTDAWLTYGAHLLRGRVDPASLDSSWRSSPQEHDLVQILSRGLSEGRATQRLRDLAPKHGGYKRLMQLLSHYREVQTWGGYPRIAASRTLRRGDYGPAVERLREHLLYQGDLVVVDPVDPSVFDESLEAAVIRFQRRHGIEPDGVVGSTTLAELDKPVAERIRQIERNLERWRWLPYDLGRRYILVDIAGFELRVIEDEHTVMDMQVIVGRDYRQTPIFNDRIRYLVLSPYWHVPASLAIKDILPLARRDPGYLVAHGFQVLTGSGAEERVVDPSTIDWERISENNFPYRFRQDPGPFNSLGRVKFMFPNEFNVYLHDTPSVGLFARTARDFSSGCIRVERPLDLAEYLLSGASGWTRERILRGMNSGQERNISLPTPVPVHMIYLTVWTEPDGTVYFRPDVYGRDARLDTALSQ